VGEGEKKKEKGGGGKEKQKYEKERSGKAGKVCRNDIKTSFLIDFYGLWFVDQEEK
jgi:hypothetical protein